MNSEHINNIYDGDNQPIDYWRWCSCGRYLGHDDKNL